MSNPTGNINLQPIMTELFNRTGMFVADAMTRGGDGSLVPYPGNEGVNEQKRQEISDHFRNDIGCPLDQALLMAPDYKREGHLLAAHAIYLANFLVEYPYRKDAVWGWIKVLLLAKDFEDAWTLLTYLWAFNCCYNRLSIKDGDTGVIERYRLWGSEPPLHDDDFQPMRYLRQVSDGRDWNTREDVTKNIAAYGGSDYWKNNFKLGRRDYREFSRWFHW